MQIRAILWDIDDTIFDYTSADRIGMRQHLEAEGLPDGYESVEQALVRWREITDQCWARFSAGETDWQGQRRDRVRSFTGGALSDEAADAWFDRHLARYEAAWELFPDFLPALDQLTADYRHGVLSNSAAHNQEHKLRTLGVRDRFEVLVCAAELGVAKPAPGAFHAACDALGLVPGEVLYVGDQPDIDAAGALAAGLSAVWLDRQDRGGRPELVRITGLGRLPGLLRGDTRFGAPSTFR
ncbi:HAD family hydrolase [Streptomyces sp. NBC_01387]|uniref:HAD family hydrolase n=1 Tax=unclassified Streptomyces TaxID=2593676 RepID=UPI0022555494|nr:HAD family hydrolase [Streptomyces sp. NBC_01500]MCX4547942.1 HAD family hydrolase [Streptomyces sp. NBC_01500]